MFVDLFFFFLSWLSVYHQCVISVCLQQAKPNPSPSRFAMVTDALTGSMVVLCCRLPFFSYYSNTRLTLFEWGFLIINVIKLQGNSLKNCISFISQRQDEFIRWKKNLEPPIIIAVCYCLQQLIDQNCSVWQIDMNPTICTIDFSGM